MRLSVITMLLVTATLPIGCGEREVVTSEQPAAKAGDIAKRPDAYYGRPVTVAAEVEAVHGPNAFTLDEDAAFAGPDVLVIVEKTTRPPTEGHDVIVEGTVRRLVTADLERDYPWFRADAYEPDVLMRFEERPVIIASSVRDEQQGEIVAGARQRPMPVN